MTVKANSERDIQNQYANDIKQDIIFIDNAISGRKGYFCLGCDRQMQAVKSTKENRISYFRHDSIGVDPNKKCTYSDETYRHKLAKEALLINKRIKVPAVYKFSLNKNDPGILLKRTQIIEAATVKAEVIFYEDDYGNIQWGQNRKIEDKYLLIKPDITFFNKNEEPILFIEIVATHKPDANKLVKLLRLGIDAVSVIIPKSSPAEIENVFTQTQHTKWIYNYEETNTEYLPISNGNTKGIPYFDEEQRKLFTESYTCRKAQLNNLIRFIRKNLESESYREIESGFKSEISRVAHNTEQLRFHLDAEEEKYRTRFSTANRRDREQLGFQTEIVETKHSDLEGRYNKKKNELEEEEKGLDRTLRDIIHKIESIQDETREENGNRNSEIGRIEYQTRDIEQLILRIIENQESSRKSFEDSYREEERSLEEDRTYRAAIPIKYTTEEQRITANFEREEKGIERDIIAEKNTRDYLPEQYRNIEEELRKRFNDLHKSANESIKGRNFGEIPELSREYENILSTERQLSDYLDYKSTFTRLAKIREFINSAEYKNWI